MGVSASGHPVAPWRGSRDSQKLCVDVAPRRRIIAPEVRRWAARSEARRSGSEGPDLDGRRAGCVEKVGNGGAGVNPSRRASKASRMEGPAFVSGCGKQSGHAFAVLAALKCQPVPGSDAAAVREGGFAADVEGLTVKHTPGDRILPCEIGSERTGVRIYISNLPEQLTRRQFDSLMPGIPGIDRWNFIYDSAGKCCGYSLCEAPDENSAELAVKAFSCLRIHGNSIKAKLVNALPTKVNVPKPDTEKQVSNGLSTTPSSGKSKNNYNHHNNAKRLEIRKKDGKLTERTRGSKNHSKNPQVELNHIQPLRSPIEPQEVGHGDRRGKQSLRGEDVLLAMQKAALEAAKEKQKKRTIPERAQKSKENDLPHRTPDFADVKPIVVRTEWASQIENLEKRIKELKSNAI